MQNKPNLQKPKTTITSCATKIYNNIALRHTPENKPNSNPIKLNSNPTTEGSPEHSRRIKLVDLSLGDAPVAAQFYPLGIPRSRPNFKPSFLTKYQTSAQTKTPASQYVTVLADSQEANFISWRYARDARRKNTARKAVVLFIFAILLCGPLVVAFVGVLLVWLLCWCSFCCLGTSGWGKCPALSVFFFFCV